MLQNKLNTNELRKKKIIYSLLYLVPKIVDYKIEC